MAKAAEATIKAGARYVRLSPYKAREVAALIKGQHVDEARRILAFTPKAASFEISKILESAIANAEHNFQVPQEELFVKWASADEGVTIKRFRPRAQGRGFRIRKRTCHIHLELERRVTQTAPPPRRSAAKGGPAKAPAAKGSGSRASSAGAKGAQGRGSGSSKAAVAKAPAGKAVGTKSKAPSGRSTKTKEGS